MSLITIALVVLAIALGALGLWRFADMRADAAERARLLAFQPQSPALFDPSMVADLPAPARRYFSYTIAPGTPLYTVAQISMTGKIGNGTKDAPGYMRMTANQTLAAPHGFLWEMSARNDVIRMAGSDSGAWTRFWLWGLAPVVRAGGTDDHQRSAFGRYAAEAVFWTPAALLPGPGISWDAVDANTARATISTGDLVQDLNVTVDAEGRPTVVQFMRWSDANPDKTFRLQPFGGTLSSFETFDGFTVPTHVEAGNFFGTEDYFPFFVANVTDLRFPKE